MPIQAADPVSVLPGVGPKRADALAEAGYRRVVDLIHLLPSSYEDRRTVRRISELDDIVEAGEGIKVTLSGRFLRASRRYGRRRGMRIVEAVLEDETGRLPAVWFNQPYLDPRTLLDGDWMLYGAIRRRGGKTQILNARLEPVGRAAEAPGIAPVYPRLEGLGAGLVAGLVGAALGHIDFATDLADPLPKDLLERYDLPPLPRALAELHRPGGDSDFDALEEQRSAAHHRLVYGKLLELRIRVERSRSQRRQMTKPHRYELSAERPGQLVSELPFRATAAQKRVWEEIAADLGTPRPMQRLVQGDVGCGKTAIAVLALRAALESGLQGAFMAPTEILAEQHHRALLELVPGPFRVALYTSSSGEDRSRLRTGEVDLAIGTHALIQDDVRFRNLGLAVIDEQQRFGVVQRRELASRGLPDVLVMTATPIPRSLAMTVYGDLDLSVIDELPPGRRRVVTTVLPERRRDELYRQLAKRVLDGEQAYVVMPFIEASEEIFAASLEREGRDVTERLAGVPCAWVHGRLDRSEREDAIARFQRGDVRVLVSTTVIEVGIDVPEASFMVIESAERFGLSQLHQLRGRVGRGDRQSYCVALHGATTPEAALRLDAFASTDDGFEIAEKDLEIRGPGEILGRAQSGAGGLGIAGLGQHAVWLDRACRDARELGEDAPRVTGFRPPER